LIWNWFRFTRTGKQRKYITFPERAIRAHNPRAAYLYTIPPYASGAQTNLVSGYTYMRRRSPEVDGSLPLFQSATPTLLLPVVLCVFRPSAFATRPHCRETVEFLRVLPHTNLRHIAPASRLTRRTRTHNIYLFFRGRFPVGDVYGKFNDDSIVMIRYDIPPRCEWMSARYVVILGYLLEYWESFARTSRYTMSCPRALTGFGLRIPFGLRLYECICVCVCEREIATLNLRRQPSTRNTVKILIWRSVMILHNMFIPHMAGSWPHRWRCIFIGFSKFTRIFRSLFASEYIIFYRRFN